MTKDIEREKMNYEKEREAFEKHASKFFNTNEVFEVKNDQYIYDEIIFMWDCWIESAKRAEKKLEGCVVVPKDQIETWWQDAEEPENYATTIETIPALGESLGDEEIMEIDEHHTIHLPSKRVYGTWVDKDGERSFITGSLEECRATVEAARGGNE